MESHWGVISFLTALLVALMAMGLALRSVLGLGGVPSKRRLFGVRERARHVLNLFGDEAPGLEEAEGRKVAERRWRNGTGMFWTEEDFGDLDEALLSRVAEACELSDDELIDAAPRVSSADSVRVVIDQDNFPTLVEAIEASKKRILIQTMLFFNDKRGRALSEALIAAQKRGVQVRVIVDHLMTLASARNYLDDVEKAMFHKLRASMEEAGIQVVSAEAAQMYSAALWKKLDIGNVKAGCAVHMKFGVFDHDACFVGSLNFGDGYLPKSDPKEDETGKTWRDGFFLFKGEELACDLAAMFAQHWEWFGGEPFNVGRRATSKGRFRVAILRWLPARMPCNPIQKWVTDAFSFEKHKLMLQNPYITARAVWDTITDRIDSQQAKKLSIITTVASEVGDHPTQGIVLQRVGGDAIRKGLHLVDFHKSTWSHWKIATSAEHKAVFYGSSNLNERSFSLDWELNVLVMDEDAFDQSVSILNEDVKEGRSVQAGEFKGDDISWTDVVKDELTRQYV